jgi:bacteriorhodopsin
MNKHIKTLKFIGKILLKIILVLLLLIAFNYLLEYQWFKYALGIIGIIVCLVLIYSVCYEMANDD